VKVRFAIFGAVLLALPSLAISAAAANLVSNPGFETGDFTDWTQGGDTSFTGVTSAGGPIPILSGNFSAALGPITEGTLSQDISTVAGTTYVVSFWLYNGSDIFNDFSGSFGGTQFSSATDIAAQDYTLYSFAVTASSTTSTLQFAFRNEVDYFGLDDVSVDVSAVPGPTAGAGLPGLILAGGGLFAWLRRRKNAVAAA
jgi:hypothetical protein